jgi:hypothetical protein
MFGRLHLSDATGVRAETQIFTYLTAALITVNAIPESKNIRHCIRFVPKLKHTDQVWHSTYLRPFYK